MTPQDVDAIIATVLAADFPARASDVEVPWLWGDVNDPASYTLKGHVDTDGSITDMHLISDEDGSRHSVPPLFESMARCDLREEAVAIWRTR